jgi:extracellular elastinolytic metalloproteinase
MSIEVDRRRLEESRGPDESVPGYHVPEAHSRLMALDAAPARRRNAYTGTWAYHAAKQGEALTGSLVERALVYLRLSAPDIDETSSDPADFVADPHVVEASGGERIVHLHQHVHGIPVFRAVRSVRFDPTGPVLDVVGDHVPLRRDAVDLVPALDAAGAVLAAARHLAAPGGDLAAGVPGLEVTHRRPRIVGALPLPASPTLLRKPPFPGVVATHLVLFYQRPDLRLGWFVPLHHPKLFLHYDLIVAANGEDAGEILFCRNGVASVGTVVARATRFNPDLEPPLDLAMPQPLDAFPPLRPGNPLPAGFPGPWVDGDETAGNNVLALRSGRRTKATKAGADLRFQTAAGSDEEKVVNAFFLCNYVHDFFYLLGFDEASGNFQNKNPPGVKSGPDAVEVRIFQQVPDDASFEVHADGTPGRLSLGAIGARHTALDAEVLIHEYTHGVTARLIAGRGQWKPLIDGPRQAQAMDEGTSDYFALTLQNYLRRRQGFPESLVFGAWSSGDAVRGGRSSTYAGFTAPFDSLGNKGFDDPHDAGMIWCAALLGMNRRLGAALGSLSRGDETGWYLVVEALRKIPIGLDAPSFLDGRDALLRAVGTLAANIPVLADGPLFRPGDVTSVAAAVRQAFAELGMGRNSQTQGGAFAGLVNDFQP